MKPPPFDYARPESLEEALDLLARHGDEAKLLAGGQSLMAMLNFRLLAPAILVDINRLDRLAGIEEGDGRLSIGALTRHHALETSDLVAERLPVLHAAMGHVAHLAIRNRGTVGGSLAHADPAAELPAMMCLLDATLRVAGPAGTREISVHDFFTGALETALGDDEILLGIDLPSLPPGTAWGFEEFSRRAGDFALAGVAVLVEPTGAVRLALLGVDETPVRARAAEAELARGALSDAAVGQAVEALRAEISPLDDLHAGADYRRHLAGVLTTRALAAARARLA